MQLKKNWDTLIAFVGSNYPFKLKEVGTTHWYSPNTGATNEYGFTALPGSYRDENGEWPQGHDSVLGSGANWWTSTNETPTTAYISRMGIDMNTFAGKKITGCSIRCVRD